MARHIHKLRVLMEKMITPSVPQTLLVKEVIEKISFNEFALMTSKEELPRQPIKDFSYPLQSVVLYGVNSEISFIFPVDKPSVTTLHCYAESSGDFKLSHRELLEVIRIVLRAGYGDETQLNFGNFSFLPYPPLVSAAAFATIVTRQAVAGHYSDPEAFWASGWDTVEHYGEYVLCTRATGVATDIEYYRAVYEHQWRLAHLAKPHTTEYYSCEDAPDDPVWSVFFEAPQAVFEDGYDPVTQVASFNAVLGDAPFLPGWQVMSMMEMIRDGVLPNGTPVKEAHITFLSEEEAQRVSRVLFDIGARVFYLTEPGEPRQELIDS